MLTALIIILVYTPLGMITLGPISTTFAHIPVIIGLLAEGPLAGLILGLVFGLASMIRAFTAPAGLLSVFFQDPLVSILPRALFPLAAWGITLLLGKLLPDTKNMRRLNWAVSGFFASAVHTALVLTLLYLLHAQGLIEKINESSLGQYLNAPGKLLFYAVALPNGIPEALVTMILTPAILSAVTAMKKRR
jgi:uncharacterized membrane protein